MHGDGEVRQQCARMRSTMRRKLLTTAFASLAMRSMKSHTHFHRVFGSMAPFNPPTQWSNQGLLLDNTSNIECPEQMLWLALLMEQAIFPDHRPHLQEDIDARLKETAEPAVLHSSHPNAGSGCPRHRKGTPPPPSPCHCLYCCCHYNGDVTHLLTFLSSSSESL